MSFKSIFVYLEETYYAAFTMYCAHAQLYWPRLWEKAARDVQ